MLVGDLLQLPPVQGRYIFEMPNNHKFATLCQQENLWGKFEVYELCHNHRQGEGNTWASILNEIREGIVTEETVNLLESRVVEDDHDEYSTCHVFYKNDHVAGHNNKMMDYLDTEQVQVQAIESGPPGFISTTTDWGTIGETQFMKILTLKVGARVMLVWNVNTPDSLVNGAMGKVIDFVKTPRGDIKCVIVEFDTEHWGEAEREKHPQISAKYKDKNGTPIFRTEAGRQIGKKKKLASARAKILQFPLKLAYGYVSRNEYGATLIMYNSLFVFNLQ